MLYTSSTHTYFSAIAVKPVSRPLVTGFRSSYRVGDVLEAKCVVADTFPAANLTWFISGERVRRRDSSLLHILIRLLGSTLSRGEPIDDTF